MKRKAKPKKARETTPSDPQLQQELLRLAQQTPGGMLKIKELVDVLVVATSLKGGNNVVSR